MTGYSFSQIYPNISDGGLGCLGFGCLGCGSKYFTQSYPNLPCRVTLNYCNPCFRSNTLASRMLNMVIAGLFGDTISYS